MKLSNPMLLVLASLLSAVKCFRYCKDYRGYENKGSLASPELWMCDSLVRRIHYMSYS